MRLLIPFIAAMWLQNGLGDLSGRNGVVRELRHTMRSERPK
jgi:hypothetical protein